MNKSTPRVLGQGKYLTLVDDDGWEYVTRHAVTGIVVIVAVTDEGKLLLVEQARRAVHRHVIELPAGLVGDVEHHRGEALDAAALRELEEETGYAARQMQFLAEGPIAVGVSDEVISFFRAHELSRVGPGGGDASENIIVHEVPLAGVRAFLAAKASEGLYVDPKIYAGLLLAGVPLASAG